MHVNNLYCSNCINPKIFKLNLFTKIFSYLLGIIFIIINNDLLFLSVYALILLILIRVSGFKLSSVFKFIKDIWFINVILIILSLFTMNIYAIVYILLGFQIVFVYNYFIYSTSSLIELRKCFIIILKPLKKLKINYYKLGENCVLLISFLPEFVSASKSIVNRQKSRGVDIHWVGLSTMFIAYINMFKKGLYLTQKKLEKQRKIKIFMLHDENKKGKLKHKGIEIVDILFSLIHICLFLLIIYKEEIYYEISFIPFI